MERFSLILHNSREEDPTKDSLFFFIREKNTYYNERGIVNATFSRKGSTCLFLFFQSLPGAVWSTQKGWSGGTLERLFKSVRPACQSGQRRCLMQRECLVGIRLAKPNVIQLPGDFESMYGPNVRAGRLSSLPRPSSGDSGNCGLCVNTRMTWGWLREVS